MTVTEPIDCVVIGAGPAGLTAAFYLARFSLKTQIYDAGESRCATTPLTRNHAGYPGGIAGAALLARMRMQASEFGVSVIDQPVTRLERDDQFAVWTNKGSITARTVLLATGVVNNRPAIADVDHARALAGGLLRYCPICDGYEVTDKRVGVIGTGTHGYDEAVFIRMYTRNVTLIAPSGAHALSAEQRAALEGLGIDTVEGPCRTLTVNGKTIVAPTARGSIHFDSIYPALGWIIQSNFAVALGAQASAEGCLVVDDHQRTSVAGLYAAGDVAKGLDQISHAMGQAGVAATTIRNDLAKDMPLIRR
jgi:thioredoxin reductase (NADPH)